MTTTARSVKSRVLRALAVRFGNAARGAKQMRVIETLALGGRAQLVLVQVGEQKIAVGIGSGGVQCVTTLDHGDAQ